MKGFIREWVKTKRPQVILGHKEVTLGLTYEFYEFLGWDDKFYSISLVYNDFNILGSMKSINTLRLFGDSEPSTMKPMGLYEVLDNSLECYETKEDWLRNRARLITKEELSKFLGIYYNRISEAVLNTNTDKFTVVNFTFSNETAVAVYFNFDGILQMPLKMYIGEPSVVKIRNYGEDTLEFRSFVERLGQAINSMVIWYGIAGTEPIQIT